MIYLRVGGNILLSSFQPLHPADECAQLFLRTDRALYHRGERRHVALDGAEAGVEARIAHDDGGGERAHRQQVAEIDGRIEAGGSSVDIRLTAAVFRDPTP